MAEKKVKEKNLARKELKRKVAQRIKPAANTVTSNRLKLLVTIVGRRKAEYYEDLLQEFDVNMQMTALANGTATEKTLSLLGLTDTDKAVIFSVIQESKIPDALHMLEDKFNTIKDGKGIACTLPISSLIGTLIYGFLSNNRMAVKEETK
ncbi:MAG: hypothetical protein K2K80_06250 [Clostridia bacterium]|nr:hypothetical protein [Clostridia bacterium]